MSIHGITLAQTIPHSAFSLICALPVDFIKVYSLFEQRPPLTKLYLITIANTGTEVIRTDIGKRMLMTVMSIL